ncbi:hypothetical protein CR513_14363, partial [Mucuna pruriens]
MRKFTVASHPKKCGTLAYEGASQDIALRGSKDLKKLPMEERLDTLKVHKIELNEDERQRKGKSIALKA